MDSHQQLNHRQIVWMAGAILIGGGYLTVPRALIQIGRTDAWFSEILGFGYSFFVAFFFARMVKLYPGKNLFEIIFELCGKWAGALLNAAILFYIWTVLVRDLADMEQIVKSTILRNTPEEIVILVFMALILFYGRSSVEITVRVADLLFPIFIIMIFILPLLMLNELSIRNMQPVMVTPVHSLLGANLVSLGLFADVFILGAFLHTLSVSKKLHASLRQGIMLSAFCLTLVTLLDISVLGGNIAGREMFPNYALIQQMHITDFLDRIDIFVFGLWLPVFTVKFILIYLSFLLGIASFAGIQNNNAVNKPVSWFILVTTILSFSSIQELFAFGNYSSFLIALGVQLPVIAVVSLLSAKKHKTAEDKLKPDRKRKLRRWKNTTHALLLASLGIVAAGFWLGKDFPLIGNLCGISYFLLLILLVVTTYKEMAAVRDM